MSEERLNEIIENINKHNILQSCCGGMTSYDCKISELSEYTLDLKQQLEQKNKVIEELTNYLNKGYLINTKEIRDILNKGVDGE